MCIKTRVRDGGRFEMSSLAFKLKALINTPFILLMMEPEE